MKFILYLLKRWRPWEILLVPFVLILLPVVSALKVIADAYEDYEKESKK